MRTALVAAFLLAATPVLATEVIEHRDTAGPAIAVDRTGPTETKSVTRSEGPDGCGSKTVHKEDDMGNSKTVHKEGC